MALIAPHGADELRPLIVDDARRGELEAEALTLPSLMMSSAAAANAVMMGAGYFTPLTGYMNRADALSVAENMRTSDGLFWPVPVVNLAESCPVFSCSRRSTSSWSAFLDSNAATRRSHASSGASTSPAVKATVSVAPRCMAATRG